MTEPSFRTILMHGFSPEEALSLMRMVKQVVKDPSKIIFAMSTPQSLQKKLEDLLIELEEEHRFMLSQRAQGETPSQGP